MSTKKLQKFDIDIRTLRGKVNIPFLVTLNDQQGLTLLINEDELVNLIDKHTSSFMIKNTKSNIDKIGEATAASFDFVTPVVLKELTILPLELTPYVGDQITQLLSITDCAANPDLCDIFISENKEVHKDTILSVLKAYKQDISNVQSLAGMDAVREVQRRYMIKFLNILATDFEWGVLCDAYNFFKITKDEDLEYLYNPSVKMLGKSFLKEYKASMKTEEGCSQCTKNSLAVKYGKLLQQILLSLLTNKKGKNK